jgi:hypothetical protein
MKQDKHNKPMKSNRNKSYQHRSQFTIHKGGNRNKNLIFNDKQGRKPEENNKTGGGNQ